MRFKIYRLMLYCLAALLSFSQILFTVAADSLDAISKTIEKHLLRVHDGIVNGVE